MIWEYFIDSIVMAVLIITVAYVITDKLFER